MVLIQSLLLSPLSVVVEAVALTKAVLRAVLVVEQVTGITPKTLPLSLVLEQPIKDTVVALTIVVVVVVLVQQPRTSQAVLVWLHR
jgi:hypothetical protein